MTYRPVLDNVLIQLLPDSEEKQGSLIIASGMAPEVKAKVIAVGEGYRSDLGIQPLTLTPGDTVLVERKRGVVLRLDGESYTLLPYTAILLVLE